MTFGRVKTIKFDDMTFKGLVRLVRSERKRSSLSVPTITITGQMNSRYRFLENPGIPCTEINSRTCPYEKNSRRINVTNKPAILQSFRMARKPTSKTSVIPADITIGKIIEVLELYTETSSMLFDHRKSIG